MTMNVITKESIKAFVSSKSFRKSNMEVVVRPEKTILTLFGNEIAYIYHNNERTLKIRNAGWFSRTTKERLNALPNVDIRQKNSKWYLNGELWNGHTISICNLSNYKEEYLQRMKDNKKALNDINKFVELSMMSTEEFLQEILNLD